MLKPARPADETTRIEALHSLQILDTPAEERFDRLTRLAKKLFGVPIALVSLVDTNRQWFKSNDGLSVSETPRDISFCGHAILGDDILMIPDALSDERFHDNPLVTRDPGIRFYAGCPLAVANGCKIGTLCLLDVKPRKLDDEERELLRDLAHMAEQELRALQMATTDELTGLSNRRGFQALAQHALDVGRRMAMPASLLFFDLNDFKSINDTFGHAEGDRALKTFAAALRSTLRESDVIGRLGGDEFAAVLTNARSIEIPALIERLRKTLASGDKAQPQGYAIRFSVGQIQLAPDSQLSIEHLLAQADSAMYQDKRRYKTAGR
ncbi:MAG: sensor domain-containing diguanylate cyclase [Burkholderiales bacterium]|nr:sensor domain-containing diguanylate cyclase [Burkholderiales bacterium]MDE2609715.1 sensor domain-containing diguanylate cyclase [Burkholderiales bacterium]